MNNLLSFVEINVFGSILILVVLFIRLLFKNQLPKKLLMGLWGLVGLRFLFPFRIEFNFSFYQVADPILNPITKQVLPGFLNQNTIVRSSFEDNLSVVLLIVWAIGCLFVVSSLIYFHLKTRFTYKVSLPVKNHFVQEWLENNRLRRPIQVRYSDRIGSPFTTGILWPIILLPKSIDWEDTQCLTYVLAHERAHIRRFDVLIKWLLALIVCLYWYNPLVWLFYRLANQDLEFSCDEDVVLKNGLSSRSTYAEALVKMEERRVILAPLTSNFSKSGLKNRIVSILQTKNITLTKVMISLVILFGVGLLFFTNSPLHQNEIIGETKHFGEEDSTIYDYGYTKEELEKFLELTHYRDYETMSISKFNSLIHNLFQNDISDEGMILFEKVMWNTSETSEYYSFFVNTIQCSMNEYNARLEEVYSNEVNNPTYWINLESTQNTEVLGVKGKMDIQMSLVFSYRILDEVNLTVKQRDEFIQGINQVAQDAFEHQIQMNGAKEDFIVEFEENAARLSTEKIEFVECIESETEIYN